jgi:cell division protein FtsI/penicillin-binding protein 2
MKDALPQAGYGQAEVVASPFQMARVAAAIANDGMMPYGRWITGDSNSRIEEPKRILDAGPAELLSRYMREVVTRGTGRSIAGSPIPIAGKTGTAELAKGPSHAWFAGFAPYSGPGRKLAFSVLVENGRYGGTAAAPIAAEVMAAAGELGLFREHDTEGTE